MSLHRFLALLIFAAVLALIFGQPGSVSGQASLDPIQDQEPPQPLPTDIPTEILFPRTRFENLSPEQLSSEGAMFEPRVVGGSEVNPPNSYPWMVSQQFYDYHYCGGMLIDAEWVLTAAHCWVDDFGNLIGISAGDFVVLGEHSLTIDSGIEQEIAPDAVYIHPLFNHTTFQYDLALVHLSELAEINAYVQPIAILTSPPPDYQGAVVTGWGDTIEGGASSDVLLEGQIQILPDSACSNYGEFFDPNSMLCAGLPEGGVDACQGDSGGPLFFDFDGVWALAGVTSWGNGCADPDYPGVYAEVQTLEEWFMSMEFDCAAQTSSVPVEDCETLKEFFISTNGAEWKDSSDWLVNPNVCSWHGIECLFNGENHEISQMYLENNNLTGGIESDFNGFNSFTWIRFARNNISGDLSKLIDSMPSSLEVFELDYNDLYGTIPESISRFPNLKTLKVANNYLSGDLTTVFPQLPLTLDSLDLSRNDFSGTISPAIYNYTLSTLNLFDNQFSGELSVNDLTVDYFLDLSYNNFTGEITYQLSGLSGLNYFDVSTNGFYGDAQGIIDNLDNGIYHIGMANNYFSGTIPTHISVKTKLEYLNVNNNELTGEIGPILDAIDNRINILYLAGNNFTGEITHHLGNFHYISEFSLRDNNLTGDLEVMTSYNLSNNLEFLNLSSNNFTGKRLHRNFEYIPYLGYLNLSDNNLSGFLSSYIYNLPTNNYINNLDLSGNQITGTIPSQISSQTWLTVLDLSDNPINGKLPVDLYSLPYLSRLFVDNTNIYGKIPLEYAALSKLNVFHFNDTNLCVPNDPTLNSWLGSIPDLASTNAACESIPPTLSVISPNPGDNVLFPRDYAIASATDYQSGMQQVDLHVMFDGFYYLFDTDYDGSDGWKLQIPTTEHPTGKMQIRLVARDHHDNQTSVEITNLTISNKDFTNAGGYEARAGSVEQSSDPIMPPVVLPQSRPDPSPPGNHTPAPRLYLY